MNLCQTSQSEMASAVEFGVVELQHLLQKMNPEALCEVNTSLSPEERLNHLAMLDFLRANYNLTYVALMDIVENFTQLNNTATEQTDAIIRQHRALIESEARCKAALAQMSSYPSKATTKKGPKRPREEDATFSSKKEEDVLVPSQDINDYFFKKEEWTPAFVLADYKRHPTNEPVDILANYDTFKTLYHCQSLWDMEHLAEILTRRNHLCVQIRRVRNRGEEMLKYRLCTDEPFAK